MEEKKITLTKELLENILQKESTEFIMALTDTYLGSIGGLLTADNMDKLNTNQHSLLAYRYLLEEVMEGGFIQLIHNGYGPYVLEGPFPSSSRKYGDSKILASFSSMSNMNIICTKTRFSPNYQKKNSWHYMSNWKNSMNMETTF
jgi:hypothetical protein